MRHVAAAPHLLDDAFVASPELALVDVDLALRLRDGIRAGEEFRPRQVVRPEFRLLHPVGGEVSPAPRAAHDALGEDEIVDVDPVLVALDVAVDPPAFDDLAELPDYIVLSDEPDEATVELEDEPSISDYPALPDLGQASHALEETDTALRKIREQLVAEDLAPSGRRLRRGFVVVSGLGAIAALALFAVDVQQGVGTLPSWLGF